MELVDDRALTGLWEASQALDTGAVAHRLVPLFRRYGVPEAWSRVCAPALRAVATTDVGVDVAVEHVLSEGIRLALDLVSAPRYGDAAGSDVVLCCAPDEAHELPLRVLAASLVDRRVGAALLGPRVPWPAVSRAVSRLDARTAVVWAQTARTADADALSALVGAHPGTLVAAAGPGWTALPAGVRHLASLDDALRLCTG